MMEHQISITSLTGAGSTSLMGALKVLLADQPYRFVSGGGLFEARGLELGMNKEEFARYCRQHPDEGHDLWVDQTIAEMAKGDWLVCESRLSHYFMPDAYKVIQTCDPKTRARRRLKDSPGKTYHEVLRAIEERDRDDNTRYGLLYPGCLWPEEKFDLQLRSDFTASEMLAKWLLEEHVAWVKRQLTPAS